MVPQLHINKDKLTRWHPEFDLDDVPDITSSDIPKPPNAEKVTTAKDVLGMFFNIFYCFGGIFKIKALTCGS